MRTNTYFLAAFVLFLTTYPTSSLAVNWGDFRPEHCSLTGKRQYSSRLWNIVGSWEEACANTPATINGKTYKALCKNEGIGGMWGKFDVDDASCPRWGEWKREECETIPGKKGLKARRYSARLWDAPKATSWQAACVDEPVVIDKYELLGPHMCTGAGDIALAKAIAKGVIKGGAALGGAALTDGVDAGATLEALGEIASEVTDYFKSSGGEVNKNEDLRKNWYEAWGVVWIPEQGCGLP